jgi:hypothetical protein
VIVDPEEKKELTDVLCLYRLLESDDRVVVRKFIQFLLSENRDEREKGEDEDFQPMQGDIARFWDD